MRKSKIELSIVIRHHNLYQNIIRELNLVIIGFAYVQERRTTVNMGW